MKIASYNLENLFNRAKVFEEKSTVSSKILKQVADLNSLFEKETYSKSDKSKMLSILNELGLAKVDNASFAILRKIRGQILKRPKSSSPEIIANGRDSWVGWVELKVSPVNATAIMNTGRVLRDVDADIIAIIEADSRVALKQFNEHIIKEVGGTPYPHVMLIDGNDDRGIDVGIMTKEGYDIGDIRTHIFDLNSDGTPIFSRDSPEYSVTTPDDEVIWIIPNHFKSKFGGNDPKSQAKRLAQAKRVAEIYNDLISNGEKNVVVLGDLNDTPDSAPIKYLLKHTTLKDVSKHSTFDPGEFNEIGTFGLGNNANKIDYLMLSPKLFARVKSSGLFRMGAWPGKKPQRWEIYPELEREEHAASDHHLIWCEIE